MMNLVAGWIEQYQKQPQHTALIQDNRQLSYAEVYVQVQQIADFFQSKNLTNQRIAIALDRGIDACVVILAVLFSGNYYVPLDIKNPAQRLKFIVQDADAGLIVGLGPCPDWLDDDSLWQSLDAIPEVAGSPPPVMQAVQTEALAAILYTSGSTGKPKGVALSHRAILNFTLWAEQLLSVTPGQRIGSLAPFYFDLSTFDIFCSLNAGATVVFMPSNLTLAPSKLSSWLAEYAITTWYTVPSILSFLALKGALQSTPLADLKQLVFAGEVFPSKHLITLTQLLPHVRFYNFFGPTETNVCCFWQVDCTRLEETEEIPIGFAACGAKLSIDENSGELLVDSQNNFSGYWQQGQLIPIKQKTYATGDKVSINEHQEYCYHGRLNRMLKCSGYRVEPAEIEHLLRSVPGVDNCAVVGIEDSSSGQRPAAVLVLHAGVSLANIIQAVRPALPAYMLPAKYIIMDQLPFLANGKIDYVQIQQAFQKP